MKYKPLINTFIRTKASRSFKQEKELIRLMPNLIDFDNKMAFFRNEVNKLKWKKEYEPTISLNIKNKRIFQDSIEHLSKFTPEELKRRLSVSLFGENGQFIRRLTTREYYFLLTREMVNSDLKLFAHLSKSSTYYPNVKSYGFEYLHQF